MFNSFDLKKEFPNYFEQVVKQIQDTEGKSTQNAVQRVENLLSANFQSLLNRLNLVYLDVNGKPATQAFFDAFVKKMQSILPADVDKKDLNIYISGGVVRALLAYIYKELHTTMHNSELTKKESNERLKIAQTVKIKSLYLNIRNRLLTEYRKKDGEPKDLEKIYNELFIFDEAEKQLVQRLFRYLKNNTQEVESSDLSSDSDNGLYEEFRSLKSNSEQPKYSQLWQTMNSAEYHLLRGYMMEQTPLAQAFVLGVGSDLDILYELKGSHSSNDELKRKLEQEATSFINSAESYFQLRKDTKSFKKSLVPIGDVQDYHKQIDRVLEQGGSMLDTLAFNISEITSTTNRNSAIREPVDSRTSSSVPVVKNFIEGIYDYVTTGTTTQKQTVRGLRALLEIPFLQLSNNGKQVITDELKKIKESLKNGTLDSDAMEQLRKMIRNAHFSGANNRAYREEKDQPLALFLDIVNNMSLDSASKIKKAFPKFLETFHSRELSGNHLDEVAGSLLEVEQFISNYTNNGFLYHGTDNENILPILRGGFLISDDNQGAAAYGSGLYSTSEINIANDYAGSDGSILTLTIDASLPLRIIDKQKLSKKLLAELEEEAKENNIELNQLLRERYKVDIICDTHVIIQNLNSIIRPKDFSIIIQSIAMEIQRRNNNMNGSVAPIKEYTKLYELTILTGCDINNLPYPKKLAMEWILSNREKIDVFLEQADKGLIFSELLLGKFYYDLLAYLEVYNNTLLINSSETDEFKKYTLDITLKLINFEAMNLRIAPLEIRGDKKIVLAAVSKDGYGLEFASDELKNDKDVVLAAMGKYCPVLKFASDELKNDKDVVLAAVSNHGYELRFASDELKNDKDVVLAAVSKYGPVLEFVSDDLKNDKDVVLAAVSKYGPVLEFVSDDLKNDKDVVLAAIDQNPEALKFASDELKKDREFVLRAIENKGKAIKYISSELQSDRRFVLMAIMKNVDCATDIAYELQFDPGFVLKASVVNNDVLNIFNIRAKHACMNEEFNKLLKTNSIPVCYNKEASNLETYFKSAIEDLNSFFNKNNFFDKTMYLENLFFQHIRNFNTDEIITLLRKIGVENGRKYFKAQLDDLFEDKFAEKDDKLVSYLLFSKFIEPEEIQNIKEKFTVASDNNMVKFVGALINHMAMESKKVKLEPCQLEDATFKGTLKKALNAYVDWSNKYATGASYFFNHEATGMKRANSLLTDLQNPTLNIEQLKVNALEAYNKSGNNEHALRQYLDAFFLGGFARYHEKKNAVAARPLQ